MSHSRLVLYAAFVCGRALALNGSKRRCPARAVLAFEMLPQNAALIERSVGIQPEAEDVARRVLLFQA